MPIDLYTHDFIYQLGDGGNFLTGEVEFNKDKKVSYRFKKISEPLQHEFMQHFSEFIDRLKLRYDQYNGLKFVQIKEKGYISAYV